MVNRDISETADIDSALKPLYIILLIHGNIEYDSSKLKYNIQLIFFCAGKTKKKSTKYPE